MNLQALRQNLKPWMLPIAMLTGVLLHRWIGMVAWMSPYLIFVMLLITYCRIDFSELRPGRFIWSLLAVQTAGSVAAYWALLPLGRDLAQGVFICIFCPTATAAPVITGMLGGSITLLATYSLASNVAVALLAPMLFTMMVPEGGITFGASAGTIAARVLPLILAPLLIAAALKRWCKRAHGYIGRHQSLSFYIWAASLLIVVGNAVSFVMREPREMIPTMIWLALGSLAACCLQFLAGRLIGRRLGDRISGAQGLGQKNTVLAIWMALTYLNPIASVAPAAYVAWQNTINSLQLFYKNRKARAR